MHVDDLESVVAEALKRRGLDASRRVVLEGDTGQVYAQDFHVRGPDETMVRVHADGPATDEVVGRFHDALRDVGLADGLLIVPQGVAGDVELPDAVTVWDVHDLEAIMQRDLSWSIDAAAPEPRSAVLGRVYNEIHERSDRPDGGFEPRLREALDSAEALIETADGILEQGPVEDPDTRDALEGFSDMLENLDDEKEEEAAFERADDPRFPDPDPDPSLPAPGADDEESFVTRAMDIEEAETDDGEASGADVLDEDADPDIDRVAEPKIGADQAQNLVTGLVHGPMTAELIHQSHYLYAYRLKLEDEANGHRQEGRIWVHSETLDVADVPDDVELVPGDVDHPAQREDKARDRAREELRERNVRKTKVICDDDNVTLIEEENVRPDPDTIQLDLEGVVGRPFWRIAGENGEALLDALRGQVVEEDVEEDDTGDGGDFMVA